ncbi:phage portal protein [Desulfotomaculum nigrificans]|uniref:phage portal protein n=1 Tax=Desulfotomaculum nigrificans TaxID=1565 RepID=UPI0001FAECDC|nr:phage portal protein [Desulfotomaculum nigrificans]
MNLQEYINLVHDGKQDWFVSEVNSYYHMNRINKIIDIKEYLSGSHKILNRPAETWNGKTFEPRRIVLQYAKTVLNFSVSYLLKNPVTITGNEKDVKIMKDIYKQGKFNRIDLDIMDKMVKYGACYEYLFINKDGKIKSKIIAPEDSYPIYDEQGNMIAFIEHYTTDYNVSYYNIFTEDKVYKWNDAGGDLNFLGEFNNPSGLPCVYKNLNELDNTEGRSDLEDFINIIDNMEDLISKYTDSIYKFLNPIPVVIGQKLNIKDGKGEIPTNLVGIGLNLDDGSDMKFVHGQLDFESFESVWKVLKQALLDISCAPAVSMNNQDVSNLSEVSIKLLFSLADIKAGLNERYIREGFEQRFKKIEKLLQLQGIEINSDNIDVVFQYARPLNETDIINNIKTMKELGIMSLQTAIENSPMIYDTANEMERLNKENVNNQLE